MDFFSHQDQARRNTTALAVLFSFAVLLLIILTNLVLAFTLWLIDGQVAGGYQAYQGALDSLGYQGTSTLWDYISWRKFGLISLAVIATVLCAIVFKWLQLSSGGKALAQALGGRRINPDTQSPEEQRILHVVEEMAIASGMPVPPVYLLAEEAGINAFAAGNTPADAVIGVTRGCIEQLKREQLQGVIAHEFSHILNGDMRLNIRLIAVLNGILFIGFVGELLLRSGRHSRYGMRIGQRRSNGSSLLILGLALLLIGWLGRFFGNLIKAAVSRQREFLADASAVQFTRNPDGIADALKIIGGFSAGTRLCNPRSSEASHLFFAQGVSRLSAMFATHPALSERIRRIQPHWNGQFTGPSRAPQSNLDQGTVSHFSNANPASDLAATQTDTAFDSTHQLNDIQQEIHSIPARLRQHAREPFSATALVFALLLDPDKSIRLKQFQVINQSGISGIEQQAKQIFTDLQKTDQSQKLPLLELSLPALKLMSEQQYKLFNRTLLQLIRCDQKVDLFEWCLYQLVKHYLGAEYQRTKPVDSAYLYRKAQQVAAEYQLVLSMLAHQGHEQQQDKELAFGRGANTAGLYTIKLLNEENCSLENFSQAVNKLSHCYPLLKPRLLKGLAECAKHDKRITAIERDILTAIAAAMDCPMPVLDINREN